MKVNIGPYPDNDEERLVEVHIDDYDVWSMDDTLALIILPMLKKLQELKHGSPFIENEDVPSELHGPNVWHEADDNWQARWDYVLNEMIYAFESKLEDRELQFWKVLPEIDLDATDANVVYGDEESGDIALREVIWKTEGDVDMEGLEAHRDRVQNGFRLFGKYYQGLWD